MNHGRRKQEQPRENRKGSAFSATRAPPSLTPLSGPPCLPSHHQPHPTQALEAFLQDLGFCRDKAKKLDTQISPQRSLMAGGPKRGQTCPAACSSLVNPGLGADLTLDLAPPLAQFSRETM